MNELRLLIIEDDKDFRDSYAKQIKVFNLETHEVKIIETFAINEKEAKEHLIAGVIDAAIVDLKLGNTDIKYKGNELVEIIKTNLRFPIVIVTANPEKIEEESGNQNDFLKIKVKGSEEGNFTLILEELVQIHLTGITKILGKTGQIEKYLSEIFWKHLSGSVNLWSKDKSRSSIEKEQSLLRHTLFHIQEYLELKDNGDLSKYHPAEFYITKPVKPNIFTGDIIELTVENTKSKYIVLTPACDIDLKKGIRKADKILLLKIREWRSIDNAFNTEPLSNSKKGELKEYIRNTRPRYHYTPKTNNISPGFIDFQDKLTLESSIIDQKIKLKELVRIATVSGPFLKDIIARYSSYYSRQGAPDFNTDELYDSLFS